MNKKSQFRRIGELVGAICGGLIISLPVIPRIAVAQQASHAKVNQCPSIFYEKPHDTQVAVPQGCPPNTYTKQMNAQGMSSNRSYPATPSQSQIQTGVGGEAPDRGNSSQLPMVQSDQNINMSSSETRVYQRSVQTQGSGSLAVPPPQPVVATVAPTSGRVNVKLVNKTNAPITYQVIGDTAPRTLRGKSEVTLESLLLPKTVTFSRQDRGLLMVTPQGSSENGMLQLTLKETTDFNMDRTSLRVEPNGSVYVY